MRDATMSRRNHHRNDPEGLVQEAARLICEEALIDYRMARRKAAERLGLDPRGLSSSDFTAIETAVIEWQQLFGGEGYPRRLLSMRQAAVKAMRLLAEFEPRLVGAVVSGAIAAAHRLQLHAFADKAEQIDIFLENRGIPYTAAEREFRFAGGIVEVVPMTRFEAGDIGIDIATFQIDDLRRPPLAPVDGQAMRRLTLAQAEALLRTTEDLLKT
jgi:hypothetical protein